MEKAKNTPNGWEDADTPLATSWGLALGSVLLLGGLLHAAQLATQGYCVAMLQRQLKAALIDESQVGVVMMDARFQQLLPREDGRVKAVRELIVALQLGDIGKAARLLETSKNLPAIPSIVKTRAHVVAANELVNRRTTLEEQQKSVIQKQLRTQQLFALLKKDLSTLLGVDQQEAKTVDTVPISLYQSGLLAGLPVLDTIPDALSDTKSLTKFVSRSVAETLVTVGAKHQSLTERLDDLHSRAQQLKLEEASFADQLRAVQTELNGHTERVDAAVEACRAELTQIVADIAKPKIEPQVSDAYGQVVDWGKAAGIELPPLGMV